MNTTLYLLTVSNTLPVILMVIQAIDYVIIVLLNNFAISYLLYQMPNGKA